ncbi:CRP/FNR family transcriptional regulator [Metabacillus malikii]|uniref:CRP/FNR family transcriptional regulator n=2 Tax=Metabacillus malikii TaxID=1504265 RepID=A0ABT9ZC29_9BACI|nr:CRP/FNR family transcriptional regulator [Metabacillus malikii]
MGKITNQLVVNTHIFSADSLTELKKRMKSIHLKSGEYLYSEGEMIENMYFIIEGALTLYKSTEDGKVLTLNYYESGDLFGGYVSNGSHGAMENAKAIEDSTIGIIEKPDIELLQWQNRNFAIEFTKWVSYSQTLTQTKLRDLMFFGKNGALASALIRMKNTYGVHVNGVWEITKKFTHDEIACLIGTPRETVTRMINQLKKDNLLTYDKGFITILDVDGLRTICSCEDCPVQVCRL